MKNALMVLVMLLVCGCTSAKFQLSQTEGINIEITSAPPTLYKIVSYDKTDTTKAFDLFHFEAEPAPVGTGTVLREDDPE